MFSLTSEEMVLFVDLWEGQFCLWGLANKDYKNKVARGTAMAATAKAFSLRWTIGKC